MSSPIEILLSTRQLGPNLVLPVGEQNTRVNDNKKRLLAKFLTDDA